MKKNAMPVLLLAALGLLGLAAPVGAAESAGAAAPGRQARVAGGVKVPLVASAQTAAQWSAQRPKFWNLRPKVRSNVE